jgi:serine/threonine protein kinase
MRSPSERLIQLLTETGLSTRAELDHCEPYVRSLCQDLPDFDSVWLDAMVQQRFLTPWQAERLQSDEVDLILVDRFQLQQPLGRTTFLAEEFLRHRSFVLRSLSIPDTALRAGVESRMEELTAGIDRHRKTVPPSLILPTEVVKRRESENPSGTRSTVVGELFVVSPFIRGWSMEELLIRGGRLPAAVVAEVGRELLTALAWLEAARLLHGDVVTRNVRLDPRGGIRLTDPFVRRLQQPQFAMTDQLTLRDCDGVAPEQVGTGRVADARSELYALGCLLWQLLTSRPIVLTADPVTRLMKQKDHDIADVRGPVPDCPEWMSRLIQSMTRRSPELRPASAAELLKQWRSFSGNSLSNCRALARQMPDHTIRSRPRQVARVTRTGKSWLWPAAATTVLGLLVFLAARSGVLPQTLRLGAFDVLTGTSTSLEPTPSKTASVIPQDRLEPLSLPAVDADGVIRLTPGAIYHAEPRQFLGSLRIVCEESPTATVLVPKETQWLLKARSIELRGISLTQQTLLETESGEPGQIASTSTHQLLAVQCAALTISHCVIQSPSSADDFVGIAWHRLPGEPGVVVVRNSVFAGGGYGLSFNHPPRRCELDNVLLANRGSGMLCEFQKSDPDSWDLSCLNVTQRFGFSLMDAVIHEAGIKQVSLHLKSTECVYSPQMAVVRLQVPQSWRPEAIHVQLRSGESGNPAIVPPTTLPAVYIDKSLGQPVNLPESQMIDNSLLLADLLFDENAAINSSDSASRSEWASSGLIDFEGPKLTPVMPGIRVERLPERKHDSPTHDRASGLQ